MSTRIIVKNLPKRYTEERMREHFSQKGTVTDVKIMLNFKGETRQFGFVGFQTEKEAKAAVKYFSETFIDTSKIHVELAKPIDDPSIPRPWSAITNAKILQQQQRIQRGKGDSIPKEKESEKVEANVQQGYSVLQTLYEETVARNAEDPRFSEFLEVMAPRAKSKTWANDDISILSSREQAVISKAINEKRNLVKNQSKTDSKNKQNTKAVVQIVPNKKPGGQSLTVSKTHITFENDEDNNKNDSEPDNEQTSDDFDVNSGLNLPDINTNGFNASTNLSLDIEWLKAHVRPKQDDPLKEKESGNVKDSNKNLDESSDIPQKAEKEIDTQHINGFRKNVHDNLVAKEQERVEACKSIADTGRLFVRNLPYSSTEADLRKYFEKFGPLSELHMPINKETKKPKGFAYVLFVLPEHAVKAFTSSDHKFFQGRLLHILPANDKPTPKSTEEETDSGGYGISSAIKKKREEKKRANANNDFSWNSLYMSADAVADSIAERLQISKADLLNSETGSPAVRLALAETHIISETKRFFELNGIVLDAFSGKKPARSDTVILVKNIPFSISKLKDSNRIQDEEGSSNVTTRSVESEIRNLFGAHGTLGRVLVPPAKTMAIIEFLEPSEAKTAFRYLAYKRFGDAPLYLEWAPEKLFRKPFDSKMIESNNGESQIDNESSATKDAKVAPLVPDAMFEPSASVTGDGGVSGDEGEGKGVTGCVLFVKNLNFETKEDTLRDIFGSVEGLRSVSIKRKQQKTKSGKIESLSMGFGFVEYSTPSLAKLALSTLQNTEVDGHVLQLKPSDKVSQSSTGDKQTSNIQRPKSNKLVVKNIPFEATKSDLQELFSAYAQLKSVRLPRKFSGGHRGFAFLEFLTNQEAANCLEKVGASSHLYGRRLVVNWADDEPGLDGLLEGISKSKGGNDVGDYMEETMKKVGLEKLREKTTRKLKSEAGAADKKSKKLKL
ncbi:hypothetical protein BB559_001338 [Furculomyces boomerangus]|uniref:RRM domain-containing protein n=2 Tax=Harpellales TaxID=61421 RepID=A0A2T9Z2B3_9FUNG|nr:hypothetical protein BB559_001338 [Furculomyces boomerangus]PVZ99040.1 hypothetical protein BB558_004952 [Smittium angustum]